LTVVRTISCPVGPLTTRPGSRERATDGKRKARPPVALIVVVGVEVKGASNESA
jgi:hypothetical protein